MAGGRRRRGCPPRSGAFGTNGMAGTGARAGNPSASQRRRINPAVGCDSSPVDRAQPNSQRFIAGRASPARDVRRFWDVRHLATPPRMNPSASERRRINPAGAAIPARLTGRRGLARDFHRHRTCGVCRCNCRRRTLQRWRHPGKPPRRCPTSRASAQRGPNRRPLSPRERLQA
jgi:hypothetical protein